MQKIIQVISEQKSDLANEPFFNWLTTASSDDSQKLAFASAMCSYVMSFRDLLLMIQVVGTSDPLQEAINAYVSEDGPHYMWYLEDMKKIPHEPFSPQQLWLPDLLPSRRAIYRMISYALDEPPVWVKLLLVAIFEATGEVFLGSTKSLLQRLERDDDLSYFGSVHYEDELSHSVDIATLGQIILSDDERLLGKQMITEAFAEYRGLFRSWHEYGCHHH